MARYAARFDVPPKEVTPAAMTQLQGHTWPGNVRELQNVVERAFALSNTDTLDVSDLPPLLASMASAAEAPDAVPTLEDAERALIRRALELSGGNKNEAARRLGIDRQRLYRKITRHGL
jgi:DNA-binding NtrC family response regulator